MDIKVCVPLAVFSSDWLRSRESVENCDWHFRYQPGWFNASGHGSRNISVVVLGGGDIGSFDRLAGDSGGRGGWDCQNINLEIRAQRLPQ